MTDFEKRLARAIERGARSRDAKLRQEAEKALTEEEFKRMHNELRLDVSEHVEACLKQLPDHFPGFRVQAVVSDRGWGAACSRDDVGRGRGGQRDNFYSRLEIFVRPFTSYHVLELVAKGTIRNKEVLARNQYQKLAEADPDSFKELIDLWVLEFAELYSAEK